MTAGFQILVIYLVAVNMTAVLVYGIDKRRAVKRKWRIPESTLLGLAAVGGSVGALCGMYIFRHKTRHRKFVIGVPVLLFLQITATCYFVWC